jgi:asparagine N-glycosylation enzyme membrane subunit Stt3
MGALLAWPAYAIGRQLASRHAGLGAAWLCAVLPSGILLTRVGNFDHHGAVALLAACWLWSSLACAGRSGRPLATRAALQALVIIAMLFTWSGSLLYLALGSGAQLAGILSQRARGEALTALGASLLVAAVPVVLWLARGVMPLGGPLSSRTLSWLHVLALLGIGTLTWALAAWERVRPGAGAVVRFARVAVLALLLGAPLLGVSGIRAQLVGGLGFIAEQDEWAATNPEQFPLFHATTAAASAVVRLGYFAYAVPLLPLYLGARVLLRRDREKQLLLLIWVSTVGLLLLSQVRYGTDFTVPGAVAFALVLGDLRSGLARWISAPLASACAIALAALALVPSIGAFHWPHLVRAFLQHRTLQPAGGSVPRRPVEFALRFGGRVREVTPETRGFLDSNEQPEYGVLVPPSQGHLFLYAARRPVPANNMGPYLDPPKYRLAREFYTTRRPERALEIVDALGVRYVVTEARGRASPVFVDALHATDDRSVRGRPSTGRLRLAASSDAVRSSGGGGNRAPGTLPDAAFKLFEVVPGAVLRVDAEPGSRVVAEIELRTPTGVSEPYRTSAVTDAEGAARLRVPYATSQQGFVSTAETFTVRAGDRSLRYRVSEDDVRAGREVRSLPGPAASGKAGPGLRIAARSDPDGAARAARGAHRARAR